MPSLLDAVLEEIMRGRHNERHVQVNCNLCTVSVQRQVQPVCSTLLQGKRILQGGQNQLKTCFT